MPESTATLGKSSDHEPRISNSPPSGGPTTTPTFAATRTDAYAAWCRSGATRSATIAWETEPPSAPKTPARERAASPAHFVSTSESRSSG